MVRLVGERDGDFYRLTWEERGGPPLRAHLSGRGLGRKWRHAAYKDSLGARSPATGPLAG